MMAQRCLILAAIAVTSALANAGPAAAEPRITAAPMLPRAQDKFGQIAAIVPTTSGQIGINPVSIELGDPDEYQLTDLGPENLVVTYQGNTYHYIEGHTNYLTLETITTTVDNQPTTTTSSVKVAVTTATADSGDQKAGDVGLTFSQDIADALRATADDAIQACGLAPAKRGLFSKRLDSVSCIIDKAVKASGENGPLNAINTEEFWAQLSVDVAANAPEYLANAIAVIASQAQKKKALIILGTIIVGAKMSGSIAAVNIPKAGVGGGSSTTTDPKKKCDPTKKADKNSPLCSNPDCQGGKDAKCSTGDDTKKGCACVLEGKAMPPQQGNKDWWDEQQKVIGDVDANHGILGTAAPSCFVNTDGNDFDGKPAADPASWCVCDIAGTNLIYPTLTQSSFPCAFTVTPTATISPKVIAPHSGPVTSCRVSTLPGASPTGGPYCTCNDNSMYPVDTWTDGGSATTGCSATRSASATGSAGTPTPTCNVFKKFQMNKDALVSAGEKFCSDKKGSLLRSVPINPYSNSQTEYFKDGASKGGQIYMFAYLDKGCDASRDVDENDCKAAVHSIFDRCDTDGSDMRQGGAASINCQWYNITAVDQCMGSIGSFEKPGSCNVGNLPSYYNSWPLGSMPNPDYDPNSAACKSCGSNLGASNCKAEDKTCLVDQCKGDKDCQACKIDCNQYNLSG